MYQAETGHNIGEISLVFSIGERHEKSHPSSIAASISRAFDSGLQLFFVGTTPEAMNGRRALEYTESLCEGIDSGLSVSQFIARAFLVSVPVVGLTLSLRVAAQPEDVPMYGVPSIPEDNCYDGIDSDYDGAVDCDDEDCILQCLCTTGSSPYLERFEEDVRECLHESLCGGVSVVLDFDAHSEEVQRCLGPNANREAIVDGGLTDEGDARVENTTTELETSSGCRGRQRSE